MKSRTLGLIGLVGAILAGLSLIVLIAWYESSLRPLGPPTAQAQIFRVESGESRSQIAKGLETAKLIRSHQALLAYLALQGSHTKLLAGTYNLSPARSVAEVVAILSHGDVAEGRIIVPEGQTLAGIIETANRQGISKADLEIAASASYNYGFLASRPANSTLEGYLFPDSYNVTRDTLARTVFDRMLANFNRQLSPDLLAGFAKQGLSLHQAVTLASIVQQEVATPADQIKVAQVFLTRMKLGQPLGSDVTVNYGAKLLGTGFSTKLASPYNTYLIKGLPPGPIASPGLSALTAVANPANTHYLYFLAGKDGQTHFATTYTEHQQNIVQYLN